jgi:hypothetical protein
MCQPTVNLKWIKALAKACSFGNVSDCGKAECLLTVVLYYSAHKDTGYMIFI